MTRNIYCGDCGVLKPMHHEDVMMGWKRRRVVFNCKVPAGHGLIINGEFHPLSNLVCDRCGSDLANGSQVIAETMWRDEPEPGEWEQDFIFK